MFPLMHVKAVVDIHGTIDDNLILGSLLPDVLRLTGCGWSRSHSAAHFIKNTLGKCHGITIGAMLHGEYPPGVDFYSDVGFKNIPWGWAFYTAWKYTTKHLYYPLPKGLVPWVFHNMVEASVDIYLHEQWDKSLIAHVKDVYSWNVKWDVVEKMIIESGLNLARNLKDAYVDYLTLSLGKYHDRRCFVRSLYEIARRKFYRHGIVMNLPIDLFEEVWYAIYKDREFLYEQYVSVAYDGLKRTYKEWCSGEI
ncbi:hypothetical protein GM182_03595 [bacterium 3DAC]|nr:hypothetical protein [Dictyoglomota bacterium]UZN22992.1 hypothetical protein GM182_03595 [bacterium 3DAC]